LAKFLLKKVDYFKKVLIYESAKESIFPQILSSRSCEVDTVSGATYSSKAIIEAVRTALEQAKR